MMKVLGREVPCIVDSGCDVIIVPKELTDRCNSLEVRASTRQIWAANNIPIYIFGETDLPRELDGRCLWTPVLVSEDVDEVMLGFDWLEYHKCLLDFRTVRLTVDGRDVSPHLPIPGVDGKPTDGDPCAEAWAVRRTRTTLRGHG